MSRPGLRVRTRGRGFDLVLVDPTRDFYGLMRTTDSRQIVLTYADGRWSQLEFSRRPDDRGRPVDTVIATAPATDGGVEVSYRELVAGRQRYGQTSVIADGAIRWWSQRSAGPAVAGGQVMSGRGTGVDPQGREYEYEQIFDQTRIVYRSPDGSTQTFTSTEDLAQRRTVYEARDATGRVTATGERIEDKNTGASEKTSTWVDDDGDEIRHSVETNDGKGTTTKVTSEFDKSTGETTITSTVKGPDGQESTHTTVYGKDGRIIRDTTSGPGGAPSGGGGTPEQPKDEGQPEPDPDPDPDPEPEPEPEPEPDDGGGDDGRPADDGAGGDEGPPSLRPPKGGHGPDLPGGPLGSIFDDVGIGYGGAPDGFDGAGLPGVIGERVRRVISDAFADAGSDDGAGTAPGSTEATVDIRLPAPPGAVDDWGDRPHPQALVALTDAIADYSALLGALGGQLRQVRQQLVHG